MENEIELKIMLYPQNIPMIKTWLNQLNALEYQQNILGNTYYDSPDLFFAKNKMGLRVRNKNHRYELTLKTEGNITGGLHIRPEYNLPLENEQPDLEKLITHFNLNLPLISPLQATFTTNFTRETWLISFQNALIEIALDQGSVKNNYAEENICELEFELKQGDLKDLFTLLFNMPKYDGMWLSSLSKAQRGYLIGQPDEIAKNIEKLSACQPQNLSKTQQYQQAQQIIDLFRLAPHHPQLKQLAQQMITDKEDISAYIYSNEYLIQNLMELQQQFT